MKSLMVFMMFISTYAFSAMRAEGGNQADQQAKPPAQATQVNPFTPFPYTTMTLEDKFRFWQGQRVILLTNINKQDELIFDMFASYSKYGNDPRLSILRRYKKPEQFGVTRSLIWDEFTKPYVENSLPYKEYAGKTGTIIDARFNVKSNYKFVELLILLDGSGEKVVVIDQDYIGFFAELDIAKGFIGRPLWSLRNDRMPRSTDNAGPVHIKKFERVTVSRADWNPMGSSIVLFFKNEEGREFIYGAGYIDNRFHHEIRSYGRPYIVLNSPDSSWSIEDPVKKHPEWPAQIWELIKKDEVAIGMTEEMVKLACRPLKKAENFISLTNPTESGVIYEGCGRDFLIGANGKVTKYIERR